jgi:ribosomal protein S18 acetylase RimI-like enzyme
MAPVEIRQLRREDTTASATLHREVLDMEFLARCGPRFLRCYHRAWIDSPASLALAAVDEHGRLVGVLLGALDPSTHFRTMVRRHGLALTVWLVARAMTDRTFGRELLTTRLSRYAGGVVRIVSSGVSSALWRTSVESPGPTPAAPVSTAGDSDAAAPSGRGIRAPTSGEITHLMVTPDMRGGGVGRELLAEAGRLGKRGGLDDFVLVTPPDLAARAFYEHLGWHFVGELTSRSGESFVRYRLPLTP